MNRIHVLKNGLAFVLVLVGFQVLAQQMNFSQYSLTPLLNNPSLMAVSEELKVDFGYRNQFGGKTSNYSTPFLAAHMPFYVKDNNDIFRKLGAGGIQLLTDRTGFNGMLATTGFSVAYAHITDLSKTDRISFGLQPGFYQRRVDLGRLTTGSQWNDFSGSYDPSLPLNENIAGNERQSFFTINAGVTYIKENANGDPFLMVSLGGNNLTRPNVSLNAQTFANPVSWNFQARVLAWENEQFQIQPTLRHIQVRNLDQTNLGSYFYYKVPQDAKGVLKSGKLGVGLWYSNQNAVVAALEINQPDWSLGFSYDFLTSSLATANNSIGAPEIIVGFRKYLGKRKKSADLNAGGTGGGKNRMDEPKKTQPNPTELQPQPEAPPKQTTPAPRDTAKPAAPATPATPVPTTPPTTEKPAQPAKPTPDAPAEPAKPAKPAKPATTKAPVKKPAAPAARKPASKKRAASNLTTEQRKKLADVVTPDEYLGDDPYKGTQKALTASERALLKKQPRYGMSGYEIDDVAAEDLKKIAAILKTRPKMKLEIGGYGCDLGGPEVTRQVSLGRAESVRRYLVSQGVPASQLSTKAYGMENPILGNESEDGKVANRRVQFKFLK